MRKIFNTAIVGGGASGLITGVELTRGNNAILGEDVIILERNDRVAKKLIATGNGQGNLSNAHLSCDNYYGDKKFIYDFFNANNVNIQEYFLSIGLSIYTDEQGRQYPLSRQASVISDVFRKLLENCGVITKTNFKVTLIKKKGDFFVLSDVNQDVFAKNVVLSFGGMAGKQFGTDGSSYRLAESFGHTTTKLFPSLVQLKTELGLIKGLKGLKEYARVNAFDGDKLLKSAVGDVQFTDFGITGSAVFQVSGHLTKCKNPIAEVEFLPHLSQRQVKELLDVLKTTSPLYMENPLLGVLNKRIGLAVCNIAQKKDTVNLANSIKHFRLKVTGSLGFDYAQVTKGGICTDDVNVNSMESKLQKGVYLLGELLDVDGDCGGYNLTFAFLTGIRCANAIKNLQNNRFDKKNS